MKSCKLYVPTKENAMKSITICILNFCIMLLLFACNSKKAEVKEEQIVVNPTENQNTKDSTLNSIQGNVSLSQIATNPNSVILTGLANHRLVTIYKSKVRNGVPKETHTYSRSYYYGDKQEEYDSPEHYMPGIDILVGYNLLNIAHYDLQTEKTSFLFDHPVLIKTLYYPCFEQDSLNKKPINRNYYMVSVYDEDTNKDTLINKKDLRHLYHFDENNSKKTLLIPADYSVIRSQYDSQNDVMYLFARQDANKNGLIESKEEMHIFGISLKEPTAAKKLY